MKRILIISSSIIVILVIAAMAAPNFIPSSVYKSKIETAATTALQREVTLLGEAKLSVFPSISAKIGGAQVANADGFEGDHMIDAGELKGKVKLLPLLFGKVEIGEVTLSDATIRLERLEDGTINWDFGSSESEGSSFDAGIDSARLINTSVYYHDRQAGQQIALTHFTGQARLSAIDSPLSSRGEGRFNGQAFDYTLTLDTIDKLTSQQAANVDLNLKTDYGRVAYDGDITLADVPVLTGGFEIDSATLGTVLAILPIDLPLNLNEIESLKAKGALNGPATALGLTFDNLELKATGLTADYVGAITLGERPTIDGRVDISADRADRLLNAGHPQLALLAAMGKLNFSADLSGPLSSPSFGNLKFTQRGDNLTTDFAGTVSLSDSQSVSGTISTSSDNPRALFTMLNIDMPPGDSLNAFSVDGDVQGSLTNLTLSNADLKLDDMQATGNVGVDLGAARPRLIANLNMPVLDVTPFLGAGADPADQTADLNQDWNDDPLALDALKTVDATIDIAAAKVVMDQITLDDALLKTRLDDGRLSAIFRQDDDRPGFRAFDGNWSGDLTLDASRSTPTLAITALADSVAAQKMLGSLTGYTGLNGIGDVHIDLTSSGNTIKALVNDLDGNAEAVLNHGALQGLNLAKMVRSASNIQDVLSGGDLSLSNFKDAISEEAETDFSNLFAGLQVTNGVAQIDNLQLDNSAVTVTGSGAINLGTRSLDIRFVPAINVNEDGSRSSLTLNNVPIPVRIHGGWTSIQYEIDTAYVVRTLAARAQGRLGDDIADSVGGEVGNVLGGIIGGRRDRSTQPSAPATPDPEPSAPATPEAEPAEEAAPEPKSLEDELKERAIDGALGAIFGQSEPENEDTPEDE